MCIRDSIKGNVKAAALQNLSGEFVTPNTESGAIALNGINLDRTWLVKIQTLLPKELIQ